MKTLIVVSGGDAPGINAVIARYTALAHRNKDEVVGTSGGFAGALSGVINPIDLRMVRMLEGSGGAYLASSREPVLSQPDAKSKIQSLFEKEKIDNMLLFGGDGTLRHVLPLLNEWGIPVIALPTTIDNDVAGTERTLGYDSACNYAYQAIEGVIATAHALTGRIFMVETLGGDTGFLALAVAYGSGAQMVLVPEYDFSLEWMGERLKNIVSSDGFALVVLSEGVKIIPELAEAVPRLTGIRLRYTRLGHAQRGGKVSHIDYELAHDMSRIVHSALHEGVQLGTMVVRSGETQLHEGTIGGEKKSPPDYNRYVFINGL